MLDIIVKTMITLIKHGEIVYHELDDYLMNDFLLSQMEVAKVKKEIDNMYRR